MRVRTRPTHRVADRLAHAAHLAVAALVDRDRAAAFGGEQRRPWPARSCRRRARRPRAAWRTAAADGRPSTSARYSFSTPKRRMGQPVGEVAVVGEQQQALGVGVEAADREHPRLGRARGRRRSWRPLRVGGVVTTPARLVEQVVDEPGRDAIGTPSTSTRSRRTSTRRPSIATSPLTVTRPSAISPRTTRRLPSPRWPAPSAGARRSACSSGSRRRRGQAEVAGSSGARRRNVVLERLDDLGARHELAERRQVVERVEAEPLEEQRRRAVQHRLARAGIAADLARCSRAAAACA